MSFVDNILKNYSYVRIAEEKRSMVEQILHQINEDGREKLSIISDFDFTLTMYEQNGESLPSTFAVVETDHEVKVKFEFLIDSPLNLIAFRLLNAQ